MIFPISYTVNGYIIDEEYIIDNGVKAAKQNGRIYVKRDNAFYTSDRLIDHEINEWYIDYDYFFYFKERIASNNEVMADIRYIISDKQQPSEKEIKDYLKKALFFS